LRRAHLLLNRWTRWTCGCTTELGGACHVEICGIIKPFVGMETKLSLANLDLLD
jgi:hypothetical protein